jgi:hypothetical protein
MRSSWSADALPGLLDAVVEGSGLTVAYLLVQVLWAHGDAYLGIVAFSLVAGLGFVLARRLVRRPVAAPGHDSLLVAVAIGAGVCGWLLADTSRHALLSGDIAHAATIHPAGWIAGVAVLGGARHADPGNDDLVVSQTLAIGLPLLALAWLFAQAAPPEARAAFSEPAFVATLTFVTTTLLAVAVTRLRALGIASGFQWRSNRPWLVVLGSVVLAVVAASLPLAAALGLPLGSAVRGALGPIGVIVAACVGIVGLAASLAGEALAGLIMLVPEASQAPPTPRPALPSVGRIEPSSDVGLWLGGLLVVAALAVVVLVALWMLRRVLGVGERALSPPGAVDEERRIVLPRDGIRIGLPRFTRRPRARHAPPRDAVGAYLALLDEIRDVPPAARTEMETPAAHAKRLRRAGTGNLQLDLLAADYELVRYADRRLRAAEHRRALSRWRSVARRLRPRPGDPALADLGRDADHRPPLP